MLVWFVTEYTMETTDPFVFARFINRQNIILALDKNSINAIYNNLQCRYRNLYSHNHINNDDRCLMQKFLLLDP